MQQAWTNTPENKHSLRRSWGVALPEKQVDFLNPRSKKEGHNFSLMAHKKNCEKQGGGGSWKGGVVGINLPDTMVPTTWSHEIAISFYHRKWLNSGIWKSLHGLRTSENFKNSIARWRLGAFWDITHEIGRFQAWGGQNTPSWPPRSAAQNIGCMKKWQ